MVPAKNTTVENDIWNSIVSILSTCFSKLVELDSESEVRADKLAERERRQTAGNSIVKPGLFATMEEVGFKLSGVIYQVRISI